MTTRGKLLLCRVLRPRPTEIRGELSHSYLENTFLRWSEVTIAATLGDKPFIVEHMRMRLAEMEDTFIEGYHPGVLIEVLPSFSGLDEGLRQHLREVVGREFNSRFRPQERLDALRKLGGAFLVALNAWQDHATRLGIDAESALLWSTVRLRGADLREFLSDPNLRSRWIP